MKKIFLIFALFFVSISFAQIGSKPSEFKNGINIGDRTGTAGDPASGKAGDIYWNDTNKVFRKYNGTSWSDLGSGGANALIDLTDVTLATPTNRFALMANGTSFVSRALLEADISDLGTYITKVNDTDGYTEIGLDSNDDLVVKIESTFSGFLQGLEINGTTSRTSRIYAGTAEIVATTAGGSPYIDLKSPTNGTFVEEKLSIYNGVAAGIVGSFDVNNVTASIVLEFPDAPGTIALEADPSGFNGNLATTDNTLQEIAQKVDDLVLGAGGSSATGIGTVLALDNVNYTYYNMEDVDTKTATAYTYDTIVDGGKALAEVNTTGMTAFPTLPAGTKPLPSSPFVAAKDYYLTVFNEGDKTNAFFTLQTTEFTYGELATTQTWTGVNTFDNDVNFTNGADLDMTTGTISTTGLIDGVDIGVDVPANTAKVTNATHTSEVTGSGALTLDPTAISNKTTVSAKATDMLLLWDATDSSLKKVDWDDVLGTKEIQIACSDLTTDITTGTTKAYFRMPYAATLTDVRVSLLTAGTTTGITVDINESGTSVLSTKLTTDATEKTSETATTAAVISDSSLGNDAEITIDFDAIPTSGQGVIVTLILKVL
jgi:hypothetical protein